MITIDELKKFQEMELNEAKHEMMIEMEELLENHRLAVEKLKHCHQVKIESLQQRFEEEQLKFRKSDHSEKVNGSCQRARPCESMAYGNEDQNNRTIKIMKTPEKVSFRRRTIKARSTQQQQQNTSNPEAANENSKIQTSGKPTTSAIISYPTTINCTDSISTSKSSITINKIPAISTNVIASKTATGKRLAEATVKSTLSIPGNSSSLKTKRPIFIVEKEVCTDDLMIFENEEDMEKDSKKPKLIEKSSVEIANEMRLNYLQKRKELFKKIKSTNKMHDLKTLKAKNHQVVEKTVFSAKENKMVEKEIIVSNNGKMFLISNKD
ncbi:unnamed protein product [Brachionus calyciflorus]|uniref:Uncharacterized protein n=1 Tax=Brachionus calyciflorus TaxID=104777 RepID=A0A814NX95_9BILA|nr:unnamed protein product [Brachionus calyciflorus]